MFFSPSMCSIFVSLSARFLGSLDSQYPALNVRCFEFCRCESGSQETRERTVKVGAAHPFRNGKCVVLMIIPILPRDTPAPKRGIDFCHNRPSRRDVPAIERPKVHAGDT